jgi:hypothetical protein
MENNPNNTANAGSTEETGKTFTQTEINAIVEGRLERERAKYADYDSLKEKAGKYDELQESKKTELQKANERAEALQRQLDGLTKEKTVRVAREKVALDTKVPIELLTGETEEDCKKQAEAILKFAKPSRYPETKSKGSRSNAAAANESEALKELARQLFGKGE